MRKLDKRWRDILRKAGIPLQEFHAKQWVKTSAKHPVLNSLADAISEYKVYPISASIKVDDFNALSLAQRCFVTGATIRNQRLVSSGAPSKPYFVPFQHCVKRLGSYAPVGGKVRFFFGTNRPFAEYATSLLQRITNDPIAPYADRLEFPPKFPLAKETPLLQAADLFAHLTYLEIHDRVANDKWDQPPTGLLLKCLLGRRTIDDFVYYNRELIDHMLNSPRLDHACGLLKQER